MIDVKYLIDGMIGKLDHHELIGLKSSLEKGDIDMLAVLKERIAEKEREHGMFCSACQNEISPQSASTFTILFGPEGFKKKSTFCAYDCLTYFMENLRERKMI